MYDYINPVPPIKNFLRSQLPQDVSSGIRIIGGMFAGDERGPALSIKLAGGAPEASEPYSRLQLTARFASDIDSTAFLIKACNELVRHYELIQGLRVKTVRIETRPIITRDADTKLLDAWAYVLIEHMEA